MAGWVFRRPFDYAQRRRVFVSTKGGITVDVDVGALTLTSQAAAISAGASQDVDAGALVLTANAADISAGKTIDVDVGAFTLTTYDADILTGASIAVDLGSLVLSAYAADINPSDTRTPGVHPTEGVSRSDKGVVDYYDHIGDAGVEDMGVDQA